jgi:hypothetical protein
MKFTANEPTRRGAGLAGRLLVAQALVLLAGTLTAWTIASTVGPQLFHAHLTRTLHPGDLRCLPGDRWLSPARRAMRRRRDHRRLCQGCGDIAVAAYDASWASWRGRAIKPHVNEALTLLGATHPELAGVEQAGAWWNRDNSLEVDIVARTAETIATVWAPSNGDRGAE